MSSKSQRRERYEQRIEQIKNSDLSFTDRHRAISKAQKEFYDSDWEMLADGMEEWELKHKVVIVGSAFLIGGIFGAIIVPQSAISGFFYGGLLGASFGLLIGTESGMQLMQFVNTISEDSRQKQQSAASSSSQKPKRICSNCGWQNNVKNKYCNDCGSKLGTDE